MSEDDVSGTPADGDDGGPYGVFGEGMPRRIVGDSDELPRRRPRKKRTEDTPGEEPGDR